MGCFWPKYKMFEPRNTARKTIFSFPDVLKRWSFQKKPQWNMIFLVLKGKMIFLFPDFPENMILPPDGKWKMILLKKAPPPKKKKRKRKNKTKRNTEIWYFPKRWSCQIGSRWDMIFLVPSVKVVVFFPKTQYFFLGRKMRKGWSFSGNTRKHDISCVNVQVLQTWRHAPPLPRKIKDDLIPQKYT